MTLFDTSSGRDTTSTKKASQRDSNKNTNSKTWWTRSPGMYEEAEKAWTLAQPGYTWMGDRYNQYNAIYISDGDKSTGDQAVNNDRGVRPVIWVDLNLIGF